MTQGLRDATRPRALLLLFLAAWLTFLTVVKPYPFHNGPPIRSDGIGYHAWTRALLKRDFTFCEWNDPNFLAHTDAARGVCLNKYPPGMALLQFPVMAALVDVNSRPPAITAAEHAACLIIGAVVLWLIALLLTWSSSMLQVPAGRAACVVLFAIFGTGLFHYSTYDSSFTHSRSALFCALLLAFAVRERVYTRAIPASVLFASGFFLFSLRTTNMLLLSALGAAYIVARKAAPRRETIRSVLWVVAGVGLAVVVQLSYNYYALRTFSLSSYGDEWFVFDRPMHAQVLFSYERGLFTYYPIFLLALVLGFSVRPARAWTLLLTIATAAYALLYGYWHSWFLGAGMGHRGFVELTPLLAIVLLIVARELRQVAWFPSAMLGTALTLLTVQIMIGYWLRTFPYEHASAEQYWNHARTIESLLTGGNWCRRSQCDLSTGRCTRRDLPAFTDCYAGLHAGYCTDHGECAPIVTIRALAATGSKPYVTAAPSPDRRGLLAAAAEQVGSWEKYLLIPVDGEHVRLRSLATGRYVVAPVKDGSPRPLTALARVSIPAENFTREGPDSAVALRAWTQLYVTTRPSDQGIAELIAASATVGERERFAIEPAAP